MVFEYNNRRIIFLTFTAGLAGLIFGCDIGVTSGTIGFLKTYFRLDVKLVGWMVSSVLVGCICGTIIAGAVGDRYGRKWNLFACAILFAIASFLAANAQSIAAFTIARFIGGISIGAGSILAPLYIAEIAPTPVRGMLVAAYQLSIVTGVCTVFFINQRLHHIGSEAWNITLGWRWMFTFLALPSLLFGALLLFISESPRWLMMKGRRKEAKSILEKLGNSAHAEFEMQQVDKALQQEEGSWSELFTTGYSRALMIGILIAIFTQFTGINAIMYYAPEIFKLAGETAESAFSQTAIIGLINLLFTIVAIWFVDSAGRKPLLAIGTFVQTISLFFMGFLLHRNISGPLLFITILVFVAAFAAALGPLSWIINSEIFPTKLRGRAMSLAILILWAGNFVVTQTFPILNQTLGTGNTFWIYGLVALASFLFALFILPETKGRTLEEIEEFWLRK